MLIATFGPSTAWVGKTITYEEGQFALQDFGQITPQAVVEYDRQGHLTWAYDGLREWAYQVAGELAPVAAASTVPAAAAAAPVASAAATAEPAETPAASSPTPPVTPPVTPTMVAPATPSAAPPVTPPVTPEATSVTTPPPGQPAAPSPGATPTPEVAAQPAAAAAASAQPVTSAQPTPSAQPAMPAQPAAQPQPAAAAAGQSAGGGSTRGWLVLGGIAVLALIIGFVAAAGRPRDAIGMALTLLAVVFVVALVAAAVKPAAFSRWTGLSPRALLITSGAAAAACFIFAGLLWWMPHYQLVVPDDTRIALDEKPEIKVTVVNRGLLGGTYKGVYAVDGKQQDAVTFPLSGGQGRELTLSLATDTQRGPVVLSLGGASFDARAVTPPTFVVAPLEMDPSPAKLGDQVVLTTTVQNTGDLGGTFAGVLYGNGQEFLKQPVKIGAGQSKSVTYDITADRAGSYDLALGGATAELLVVKPVRLANGYVFDRRVSGGRASLTITNKTGVDAIAVLTSTSNKSKPVLAVYVRKGKKATVGGIRDGGYILWNSCGTDFNWTMRGFYTTEEYKRWLDPLKFDTTASTKYWTTRWSDAYYNYSQKHSRTTTQWTNWKVTLGTGESKYTKLVEADGFPQL